jgi:hypothetical protein
MDEEAKGPPYLWWTRETLEAEGFRRMYESYEWARMEVHPHGTDTSREPVIRLVDAAGHVCGEYDVTHTCPPDCPPPPPPPDDGDG